MTGLFICNIKNLITASPFDSLSKKEAERVFSHALLLKGINILLGLSALPKIIFEESGKPRFEESCGVHFSLSHSKDLVAAAISSSSCGVDVEFKKPRSGRFIKKIMENESLDCGFYELWCLKEAYFKLKGEGNLRRPSGIYLKDDIIYGPDGKSVGKIYDTVPDYALALFSYSAEFPARPVVISSDELFSFALRTLDMLY